MPYRYGGYARKPRRFNPMLGASRKRWNKPATTNKYNRFKKRRTSRFPFKKRFSGYVSHKFKDRNQTFPAYYAAAGYWPAIGSVAVTSNTFQLGTADNIFAVIPTLKFSSIYNSTFATYTKVRYTKYVMDIMLPPIYGVGGGTVTGSTGNNFIQRIAMATTSSLSWTSFPQVAITPLQFTNFTSFIDLPRVKIWPRPGVGPQKRRVTIYPRTVQQVVLAPSGSNSTDTIDYKWVPFGTHPADSNSLSLYSFGALFYVEGFGSASNSSAVVTSTFYFDLLNPF